MLRPGDQVESGFTAQIRVGNNDFWVKQSCTTTVGEDESSAQANERARTFVTDELNKTIKKFTEDYA